MPQYFFTFGTDERFPFGVGEYVMVKAETEELARKAFSDIHPNRPGSDAINCAFVYPQHKFEPIREKYYRDKVPSEVLVVRRKA